MTGPLAYEPSVQAILAELLPSAALVAGRSGLRGRVTWSVIARATGIGEIEGGELILVPEGRARSILDHLRDLEAAGVSGVVIAGHDAVDLGDLDAVAIPIVLVPPDREIRSLQADIERFVARRRRELFALERRLHSALTEAAIAGADLEDLLRSAADVARKTSVLDRDGDVLILPRTADPPSDDVLVRIRIAIHDSGMSGVRLDGASAVAATAVLAGNERRGIVMLIGDDLSTPDEDEAVLRSLASACAIVLSRTPNVPVRQLEDVLRVLQGADAPKWKEVIALALTDRTTGSRQLERAAVAELSARGVEHIAADQGNTVVVIAAAGEDAPWDSIVRSIGLRLGTGAIEAGIGRERREAAEAPGSVWEAREALSHAEPRTLTRFSEVELSALLGANPAWEDFARARLGPLIEAPGSDELLRTVRAYLKAGFNARGAAAALHVHRNTLLYRLRRVRQLLGIDLDDANAMFELDLAMRVLESTESTRPEKPG